MRNYFHQNEAVWGRHGIDPPRKSISWGSSQLASQSSWGEGFIKNSWVKARVEHVVNMLVWKHVCTRFGATREGWADPRGGSSKSFGKDPKQAKTFTKLRPRGSRRIPGFTKTQKESVGIAPQMRGGSCRAGSRVRRSRVRRSWSRCVQQMLDVFQNAKANSPSVDSRPSQT